VRRGRPEGLAPRSAPGVAPGCTDRPDDFQRSSYDDEASREAKFTTGSGQSDHYEPARSGEVVSDGGDEVTINTRQGQTLGALGSSFAFGLHYAEVLEYEHERRQAALLGASYDVRALDAAHGRTDGLGNPDVIVRTDGADAGAYADLKRLDPTDAPARNDPDFSRRVEKRLRDPFGQDERITMAVVDGRDVGLTVDAAVRGVRRALGFWRQQGRTVTPEQRMIVFTGDGSWVVWRGDTGAIDVSS
jgi:hypothetical protein